MTDLRKAAQQALEALEFSTLDAFMLAPISPGRESTIKAITALRDALAEPVQESSDMAEQLADALDSAQFYRRRCEAIQAWQSKMRDPERVIVCDILANGKTLDPAVAGDRYTVPRPAEPVQEPVAWMYTGIKSDGSEHGPHLVWRPEYMDAMSASKGTKATPLYTSPPQREPLTDEDISVLWHQSGEQPFKFARMLLK